MDHEKQPGQTKSPTKNPSPRPLARSLEDFLSPLSNEPPQPKSDEEAIAAAMEAMQRLALETDLHSSADVASSDTHACAACGNQNPPANRFCATCGASLPAPEKASRSRESNVPAVQENVVPQELPPGPHQYHHHYHHHYFSYGEGSAAGPAFDQRSAPALPAREAPRPRSASGGALSRVEIAVRKIAQDWAAACNVKHLDDLVGLYAADAVVLRPNVPPVRGTAAIHEYFFSVLEAGLGDVEMEALRTEVIGDVAYQAGRCQMLVPVTMNRRREERGKYLIVAARQSGDWKILSDCWSTDLSLGVAAEPTQNLQAGTAPTPKKSA